MDGRDCFRHDRLPVGNSELGLSIDMASAPSQRVLLFERVLGMPAHDHHDRAHQDEVAVNLNSILAQQKANSKAPDFP
jgi:hypothetical protein